MKNILFDFGNIFVDLDFEEVNMGIQTWVGMGFKGMYLRHSKIFDQYERGELPEEDFIKAVSKVGIPESKVVDIWNSMIVGIPPHRLEFIKSLQKDYNIYLYSNINTLHEKEVERILIRDIGMNMNEFRALFKGSWFSHHIGFRKPEVAGFEMILKEIGISPKEILFIDDSEVNVQGAEALGMPYVVHNPEDDIAELFAEYVAKSIVK